MLVRQLFSLRAFIVKRHFPVKDSLANYVKNPYMVCDSSVKLKRGVYYMQSAKEGQQVR